MAFSKNNIIILKHAKVPNEQTKIFSNILYFF